MEAGSDEGLNRLGNRDFHPLGDVSDTVALLDDPPVAEHANELLSEKRIAAAAFEQSRLRPARQDGLGEKRRDQPSRVLPRER
jgi:hypothetical protein